MFIHRLTHHLEKRLTANEVLGDGAGMFSKDPKTCLIRCDPAGPQQYVNLDTAE
jgi:hypothetical protein